jgi:hypothetical protein
MVDDTEDWTSYKRLVLSELQGLKKEVHEVRGLMLDLRGDMIGLKVKVATVSGMVSLIITALVTYLSK